MKTRILNIGIIFCSVILFSAFITGCSKLKAGDTFTATADGVEFCCSTCDWFKPDGLVCFC